MNTAPGISAADALVIVSAVERFCMEAGRNCYAGYTPEVLTDYIRFHMAQGTLAWVREGRNAPGDWTVTGVAVAWQCDPEDLFQSQLKNRTVFNWQPDNPQGRVLFIADVVATTAPALAALLQRLTVRFPRWRHMPIYTFRHGRMVYMTHRTLVRLWKNKVKHSTGGH